MTKKLGIGARIGVRLVCAPRGFEKLLGSPPPDAVVKRHAFAAAQLIIWFVRSAAELRDGTPRLAAIAEPCRLWVAWPKSSSRLASLDLTGDAVRAAGLAAGLVDYKICAIDADWTALLFKRRGPRIP